MKLWPAVGAVDLTLVHYTECSSLFGVCLFLYQMWTMPSTEMFSSTVLLHDVVSDLRGWNLYEEWTEHGIIEALCVYTTSVFAVSGVLDQSEVDVLKQEASCRLTAPLDPLGCSANPPTHTHLHEQGINSLRSHVLPAKQYTWKSHQYTWGTYWTKYVIMACANVAWAVTEHLFGSLYSSVMTFGARKWLPLKGIQSWRINSDIIYSPSCR